MGTSTNHEVSDVARSVGSAGEALQRTVDGLRRLHGPAAPTHPDFQDMRSLLLRSAILYKDFHLPRSSKLVQDLDRVMCLYENMKEETFCKHIAVVEDEMKTYAKYAKVMVQIHEWLLEDLNVLHTATEKTIYKLEREGQTHQENATKCEKEGKEMAQRKKKSGKAFAFFATACTVAVDIALLGGFPLTTTAAAVGAGASTACASHELGKAKEVLEDGKSRSLEHMSKAHVARDAVHTMNTELLPAIKHFIIAIEQIASFLQVLQKDVSNFALDANRVLQIKRNMILYLDSLKAHTFKIRRACDSYVSVLPIVKAGLSAIGGTLSEYDIKTWVTTKASNDRQAINYILNESLDG